MTRRGESFMGTRPRHLSISELFWQTLDAPNDPTACWPWPVPQQRKLKYPKKAYGVFKYQFPDGKIETRTHRIAWLLTYGFIPQGLQVCHHCDYPPCCNPWHLFLGTPQANVQDACHKGRRPHLRLQGRWSQHYPQCRRCQSTKNPHAAHGLCGACAAKERRKRPNYIHWRKRKMLREHNEP